MRLWRHIRAASPIRPTDHCAICGSTRDLVVDHIHPLVRGGDDQPENLRILCRICNSVRRDRPITDDRVRTLRAFGDVGLDSFGRAPFRRTFGKEWLDGARYFDNLVAFVAARSTWKALEAEVPGVSHWRGSRLSTRLREMILATSTGTGSDPAPGAPSKIEQRRPVEDLLRLYGIDSLRRAGAVRGRRQISFDEYIALKRHFEGPRTRWGFASR